MCVVGTMASAKLYVQYWLFHTITLWESFVYGITIVVVVLHRIQTGQI